MLTDKRGKLLYVNPAWTLTYGYSQAEAIGETPRLLRSPLQSDEFYQEMWKTILDPRVGFWRGEVVNQAKDGHLVPVLLTITPYRQPSGEVTGYMGIAVDLTEQKRMETQILRQDRLASIGMLASGLAHEIGNPLGVIRGRAELLMSHVRSNETAAKNLDVIIGQIDRISGLIQSLLRVSRVPEEIMLREITAKEVATEVATLMQESCRRSGIELRLQDLDFVILAEPSSLQQVLLNLVINSTHAIADQQAKGPGARLKSGEQHFIEIVGRHVSDGSVAISVTDSGCGIPATNLKKLFQPFFTTKAAGRGTGMGLAIVSKLVEEMRGSVTVESAGPGCGATVSVVLRSPQMKK